MKIIRGERGRGKTYALIRESAERGIPILCTGILTAGHILQMATEIGLKIPEPIIIGQTGGREDNRVLVDNLEYVFHFLTGAKIEVATTSVSVSVEELEDWLNRKETKYHLKENWLNYETSGLVGGGFLNYNRPHQSFILGGVSETGDLQTKFTDREIMKFGIPIERYQKIPVDSIKK